MGMVVGAVIVYVPLKIDTGFILGTAPPTLEARQNFEALPPCGGGQRHNLQYQILNHGPPSRSSSSFVVKSIAPQFATTNVHIGWTARAKAKSSEQCIAMT